MGHLQAGAHAPATGVALPARALRDVARTREGGLAGLAEAARLNREHLYRMLSENGNPELRSLEALLDALGFRLSVELKATG